MFINKRLYIVVIAIVLCFIAGYRTVFLFTLAQLSLLAVIALCLYEIVLLFLFRKNAITCERECSERFSNGDENEIILHLSNLYPFPVTLEIMDEIPPVFQRRDLLFKMKMKTRENKTLKYSLRPVRRGVYNFGCVNVLATTKIGFVSRRFKSGKNAGVKVYPSYILLKQYAIVAGSNKLHLTGNKKVRKLGQQLEPDQIKDYVKGDDYRIINWKATARRNKLMANVFREERAQNVFCVIDKGRTMQSAFEGMTLLDYSINAALAISYIAMQKGDKTGLLTFERNFDTLIHASRTPVQMNRLMEALYAQQTIFAESDYLTLYRRIDKDIRNRSLLLFFTNFDSVAAMQRQLRYLTMMAKRHTLLVIFFENTELDDLLKKHPDNKSEFYESVIAEKMEYEKRLIVHKLRQHNILALLTHPDNLTVDVINRYLEIKARGDQ
jgi:uncharacterized protein (DUF58 family)